MEATEDVAIFCRAKINLNVVLQRLFIQRKSCSSSLNEMMLIAAAPVAVCETLNIVFKI